MEYGKITLEDRILCVEAREREELRERRKKFIRSTLLFILRKILLLGSVAVVAVVGAFMFQALEAPNELEMCKQLAPRYSKAENDQAMKLLRLALAYNNYVDANPDNYMEEIQLQLRNFSRNVVLRLKFDGRNCSLMGEPGGETYKWSFYGALLFSTTIMTTIGYGNIVPVTSWGRLVTIVYGLVSIPLMLLCLATMGDLMAQTFRFIYINFCCLVCCRRAATRRQREAALSKGKGDHPSGPFNVTHTAQTQGELQWGKTHVPYPQPHATSYTDDDINGDLIMVDDDDEDEDYENIPIPITLVLFIEFVYVAIGAVLFIKWEGWSVIKSFYYCFVTLSTIGFGDIIPGTVLSNGVQPTDEPMKLIVICLYMLFGLAFISMAFDLIQYEINHKVLKKQKHNHRWEDSDEEKQSDEELEENDREKKE